MSVRFVRLGTPRLPGEGLRVGSVRRSPRGVPKSALAVQDWYDVRFSNLAPSAETLHLGRAAGDADAWRTFLRRFRSEVGQADASRTLDRPVALSRRTDLSLGCDREDEARCHCSVPRALLAERGAMPAPEA